MVRVKSKKKYIFSVLLFLSLLIGTYYFILKDYSIKDFINSIKICDMRFIFLSFLCVFSYIFFASFYLKRTLHHFGYKINWYQALGYHFTEVYFSAITPSSLGGQPVQMVEMNKDGLLYRMNGVVILLNTILYKIALIVLAIISFFLFHSLLFSQGALFSWLTILGFITTILVTFLFIFMVYSEKFIPKVARFLLNFGEKIHIIKEKRKWEEKLEEAATGYHDCAVLTKKNKRVLIEGFIILFLQRISLLSISYFIYLAFGLHELTYYQIVALQIGITLASDFMPFPGGVVVSEGLLLQINKWIYGAVLATSGMILLRGISFYLVVLFSGIFYLFFHFIKRKGARKI